MRAPHLMILAALVGCGEYGAYDRANEADGNDAPWLPDVADTDANEADTADGETDDPDDTADTAEPDACDAPAPLTMYLSPDDSNSMTSSILARHAATSGASLRRVPIRKWEFLNDVRFGYPAAPAGTLGLHGALRPFTTDDGPRYALQLAVRSPDLDDAARDPIQLTFVIDTSGSMTGAPLDLAKATLRAVAGRLREGDRVSMVTWSDTDAEILSGHPVTGPDDPVVLRAIDRMKARGGTDLSGGLRAGYRLAREHAAPDRIDRILLLSDGGANLGITDAEIIAEHAGGQEEEGIYMVGVGVGTADTYNDRLMDEVTDAGKGAAVFVGSVGDAQRYFHHQFVNTFEVAARDLRLKLDLPEGFAIERFSGEEASTDPTEVEPQHLAPNDTMAFHLTLTHCDDLTTDDLAPITATVRWTHPDIFEERTTTHTWTVGELLGRADDADLLEGGAAFWTAKAIQGWQRADDEDLRPQAQAWLDAAAIQRPSDPDLAALQRMIDAMD